MSGGQKKKYHSVEGDERLGNDEDDMNNNLGRDEGSSVAGSASSHGLVAAVCSTIGIVVLLLAGLLVRYFFLA